MTMHILDYSPIPEPYEEPMGRPRKPIAAFIIAAIAIAAGAAAIAWGM